VGRERRFGVEVGREGEGTGKEGGEEEEQGKMDL